MNLTHVLLAVALAAVPSVRAADRFVTNGKDYDANDPVIPGTFRAAIEEAQSGDTIHIARNLIVNTFNRILIPAGLDNLTITGPEEGPAQIRAIIEPGKNSQNNAITVQGDNVVFRKLTFRDVALTFGDVIASIFVVEGGTVRDCQFTQRSKLSFANMNNGLAERCVMKVVNFNLGEGAIEVAGGDGTVVRECEITLLGGSQSEEALGANGGTNLRFEDNVLTNGDLSFWAESGKVIDNTLVNRVLDLVLADPAEGPGPYEFVGNECGALVVKARNFIVRENIISGRVTGRKPPAFQVVGGDPEEKEAPVSLHLIALDGPQPVEIYENVVNGGTNGVYLSTLNAGMATFTRNEIRNAKLQGMIVTANSPVEVSFNTFEKCGNTKRALFGPYPNPALHVRDAVAAVLVKENTFLKCRGAAIIAHDGSPVFDTNRITRGDAAGMLFYGAVTPVFVGVNRIEQMGRCGMVVKNGTNLTVEGVVFEKNGICGLSVEAGATVTSRNNTFTSQAGPGIKLATESKTQATTLTARARVDGGTFAMNKGAGVLVGKGASCEIVGGQFTDNSGPGIDLVPAGVTKNTQAKQANGDIDFPEQLTFDDITRMLRGKAEPGSLVRLYRTEDNERRGNPKNGEGAMFIGSTTATGGGDLAISPGPTREGDLFTFTATRAGAQPVTSEFSENIAVPPSPPFELISVSSNEEVGNDNSTPRESSDGGQLTGQSVGDTVSANGRFVVFSSRATNLVNDDTNATSDVFVRDRMNGTTERVNVNSSGEQAFRPALILDSGSGSISADGRFVAFSSNATNLVAGDVNSDTDVFVRDRETNTTIAITDPTEQPNGSHLNGGWDPSISPDGSVVAFVTVHRNFAPDDTNDSADIYVRARTGGPYQRVSLASDGSQIPGGIQFLTGIPRLSGDGRHVIFLTAAKLVPTDTNNFIDVYLRDRQTNTTELITRNAAGNAVGGGNHAITPDGRFVVFSTDVSLAAADTNTQGDVYVLDRSDGSMHFVSPPPAIGYGGFNPKRIYPGISADGRFVVFQGDGKQEPPKGLTSLETDIYSHDRQRGITIKVTVGNDGVARSGRLPAISADGTAVLFQTSANNYVPGDTNISLFDIYARTLSPDDFEAQ